MVERIFFGLNIKPRGAQKPLAAPGSQCHVLADPNEVRRAIVFVHGFWGDALTTWNEFPLLILEDKRYNNADVFFYGYDSTKRQLGSLANDLNYFLDAIVNGAVTEKLAELGVPEGRGRHKQYDDFILVGHSLGGVVIRQAVLYATKAEFEWINKCKVVLFAPAHCGARFAKYIWPMLGAWPCLGRFFPSPFLKYAIPAGDDLHPEKSPYLPRLREETEQLATRFPDTAPSAYRARCVFGAKDNVVVCDHYNKDYRCAELDGHGHMSVCKPHRSWKWPLDFVLPEGNP